ncbi:hypothetical protein [Corynebacterium silvaticum]|uniref:Uncharacterized protein n=1 Tax=Corynebacterium silvaticum TaxID=2320431 RepID=A0A7Y4PA65_9CORY|nr:hypothetical protein [Corynebacterium silvaticum]ARU46624.1 hypothetical protein CBE74_09265 [Corynebacterium silvaticum]MBH5299787.1 hypothetical protein [Corynebacterium silvaticum]NOM63895.1 hypothetical protein [Corynebacterium silvaticum]NON71056.1 hypothetical protein [Corynebacterium silvaticum]TFA91952.1 hypothetical protein EU802_08360 [Corynebacterium silvaticum]
MCNDLPLWGGVDGQAIKVRALAHQETEFYCLDAIRSRVDAALRIEGHIVWPCITKMFNYGCLCAFDAGSNVQHTVELLCAEKSAHTTMDKDSEACVLQRNAKNITAMISFSGS